MGASEGTGEKAGTEPVAAPSRDDILRSTYAEATKWLREQHLDQFNAKRAELAKAKGVEWKPALTERERAAADLAKILHDHPDLVDQVVKS